MKKITGNANFLISFSPIKLKDNKKLKFQLFDVSINIIRKLMIDLQDYNILYPFAINVKRETQLHLACLDGRSDVVQKLLKLGADPVAKAEYDQTPLHYACCSGCVKIVEILLDNGARNKINTKDSTGFTPLAKACIHNRIAVVECLLKYGANMHIGDDWKKPLNVAKEGNNVQIVQLLENHQMKCFKADSVV